MIIMSPQFCDHLDRHKVMLHPSFLTAEEAEKITERMSLILKCNERRLKLEKLLKDNGFDVDLVENKLDPKMANLFPGLDVNFLEVSSKLLADSPWINKIDLLGPTEDFRRLRAASNAHIGMTNTLRRATRTFNKICPQPSQEELDDFETEMVYRNMPEGTYWLTNQGRIGNSSDPVGSFIVDGLLYHFHATFPNDSGTITYVKLSTLEDAIVIRNQMKEMSERAVKQNQEHEERRKKAE